MRGLVYRHRRKDTNEVFYVGMGTSIQRPFSKVGRSKLWKNIANKAGYNVEIVATGLTKEEAVELEILLIQHYSNLCNWTIGGEVGCLGYKHTPEAIQKIGEASKGRKLPPMSEERKELIREIGKNKTWKPHIKAVKQYNKDGDFIKEWESAEQAGQQLKINSANICSCRNGKRKTAGGFIWI